MSYQAHQYSPAVQVYAYASLFVFLISLVVFPPLALVIAAINIVVLVYSRLS